MPVRLQQCSRAGGQCPDAGFKTGIVAEQVTVATTFENAIRNLLYTMTMTLTISTTSFIFFIFWL